jgi:hypothetical protein
MARLRVVQYQIEWNIRKGSGEAFFVTVDDEGERPQLHRVSEIDDDSFEVIQHLVNGMDSLLFDPETETIGTTLMTVPESDTDFDDFFEPDEDDEEDGDDDEEEEEEEDEAADAEAPTDPQTKD